LVTSATPTSVCEGFSATLTASGASTYSWAAASAPGASVVVTPATTTLFVVTGTSSAGCPATTAHVLFVYPNPTVTTGAVANKTMVCAGGTATLTSAGADIYSWDTGRRLPPTSSIRRPQLFILLPARTPRPVVIPKAQPRSPCFLPRS
jgi:hypothetical protein